MSYWLEDAAGAYLGDLASNLGLRRLREVGGALGEFIGAGEADEELARRVAEQARGDEATRYVADLLDGALSPVFVTDGSGEGQVRGSVGAETTKRSAAEQMEKTSWAGADAETRKERPEFLIGDTANVFCPTGEGGGVDPTCPSKKEGNEAKEEEDLSFIREISPSVTYAVNPSGRVIKLKGDSGEAIVRQGAGDKKWRLEFRGLIDEVSSRNEGIREALKTIDSEYNRQVFEEQSKIIAEGEEDLDD